MPWTLHVQVQGGTRPFVVQTPEYGLRAFATPAAVVEWGNSAFNGNKPDYIAIIWCYGAPTDRQEQDRICEGIRPLKKPSELEEATA